MRILTILFALFLFMSTCSKGVNLQDEEMSNENIVKKLEQLARQNRKSNRQ